MHLTRAMRFRGTSRHPDSRCAGRCASTLRARSVRRHDCFAWRGAIFALYFLFSRQTLGLEKWRNRSNAVILLVDDDKLTAAAWTTVLRMNGFEVVWAPDGA